MKKFNKKIAWSSIWFSVSIVLGCVGAVQLAESAQASDGQSSTAADAAGAAGWELALTDQFERTEIGGDWEVLEGSWKIADGKLQGSGVIISSKSFPPRDPTGLIYTGGFALGYLRMEFGFTPAAAGDAGGLPQGIPEWGDVGAGCYINALWEGGSDPIEPGYTFQLTGRQDDDFKMR
ncbi:MAG: hypothetical protein LC725_05470 [Lentisphaerae bacterium]|nr:hypothetical protein [Lentisphaerota bacterium]